MNRMATNRSDQRKKGGPCRLSSVPSQISSTKYIPTLYQTRYLKRASRGEKIQIYQGFLTSGRHRNLCLLENPRPATMQQPPETTQPHYLRNTLGSMQPACVSSGAHWQVLAAGRRSRAL